MFTVDGAGFPQEVDLHNQIPFFLSSDLKLFSDLLFFSNCSAWKFQAIGPLNTREVLPKLRLLYRGSVKLLFLLRRVYRQYRHLGFTI